MTYTIFLNSFSSFIQLLLCIIPMFDSFAVYKNTFIFVGKLYFFINSSISAILIVYLIYWCNVFLIFVRLPPTLLTEIIIFFVYASPDLLEFLTTTPPETIGTAKAGPIFIIYQILSYYKILL